MKLISKETIQKYSQTAGERNEIDEILEPVLLAQRIYGLQILDRDWSWKKYGIYRIVNFLLCIYITLGTLEVCANTPDLNLIVEGIITMLINVQMVVKLLLFICQRKNIQANYLKSKMYIYNLVKDSPLERKRVLRNVKLLVESLKFIIIIPVACYLLIALWYAFKGKPVTLSRSTSTLMPMTSPYYEIGLLIHLCYLIEASFCLLVVDVWYVLMCLFFIAASTVSTQILQVKREDDSNPLYAKRLDVSLRNFYVLHVEMMEYLNRIKSSYKWLCLVPITAIIIETSIFLMLMKEEINLQLAAVMLPAFSEMFAYNWFGERISTTADDIKMALLNFDWTNMNLKDQKKYYIMTCYMNRKFSVETAFGNDLSLLTLSSIYKASYQLFTVFSTT